MQLDGFSGTVYKITTVISKLAYINILWILFTLLGLVVVGVMPATVGLFAVTRKWIMGDKNIPIFSTFWQSYRKEFLKANGLGIILIVFGFILYIDFQILPSGGFYTVLRFIFVIVTILYSIVLLYIFPVYVHYDWNIKDYLKNALLLGIAYPHFTLLMILGVNVLYFVCLSLPSIIPFFSVSTLAVMLMWLAYRIIKRVEDIQEVDESS